MQELANAFAERIVVTPSQAFSSFAVGSVEPSSNVGPWLKNCLMWFVFDDVTARYVPIKKGGFDTVQKFQSNGTYTVPDDIYKLMIEGWGAGGGGTSNGGGGDGAGGGGGGWGMKIIDVTPGQSVEITVGSGGGPGTAGTATIIKLNGVTIMTANGGGIGSPNPGASGGVVTDADVFTNGGSGSGAHYSAGGLGGDSPRGGAGGVATDSLADVLNGKFPGGGGSGGTAGLMGGAGGTGGNGQVLIWS